MHKKQFLFFKIFFKIFLNGIFFRLFIGFLIIGIFFIGYYLAK